MTSHPTEPGAENLKKLFASAVRARETEVADPRERGMAFPLVAALQNFYFDGNTRLSRFTKNGVLMSHGVCSISASAERVQELNEDMTRFYLAKDAKEMMTFRIDCEPKSASTPKPTPSPSSGPSL